MIDDSLVTLSELKKQIKEIEGVDVEIKIDINPKAKEFVDDPDIRMSEDTILVRPYDYERLPDYATVDDLRKRISKCLEPFIYFILPNNN